MRALYILTVVACVLTSCNDKKLTSFNKDSMQGTWLVQAIEMDTDFYKPNTLVMEFNGDSLYYSNLKSNILGKRKLQFYKDSLSLDTIQYPFNKFSINQDRLQFVRNIGHRIQPSDTTLSVKIVEAVLVSNTWESKKGVYSFDEEESKISLRPNDKNVHYTYCFEVSSYKNSVFLQQKGNQLACDRDPQFIEQVLSISDKEIVTFGFVDGDFKKIIYTASSKVLGAESASFQLCNQYINKDYPRDRYYYQGTEYKGGLYHIRKIFSEQYKVPEDSDESGIFQVRFVVNCEGKTGMFETQAFDNDYKLKEFSSTISDQILKITKGLQEWNPGRNPKTNQVVDTYFYLSYKIKNGKIIRIYP